MFHGFDFDPTMLCIACMNMITHGIDQPQILRSDTLAQEFAAAGEYTLVLANSPFKGSLDENTVSKSLTKAVKTRRPSFSGPASANDPATSAESERRG